MREVIASYMCPVEIGLRFFSFFVFLLELQRFCFQRSSCHSFNTTSFFCEYKINHCIEFITGQKFLVFFPIEFNVSKVSKQRLVFDYFWLLSKNNQPTLDWKFKNDWTKRLQKLAKGKPGEKNE